MKPKPYVFTSATAHKIFLNKELLSSQIFYLGTDYQNYLKLKSLCLSDQTIELAGQDFHTILSEIQDEVLEFSHSVNRRIGEECWLTQIASRNSSGVPIFRYLAYFVFAQRMSDRHMSKSIVFICEEMCFATALGNHFGIDVNHSWKDSLKKLLVPLILIKRLFTYLYQFSIFWLFSRIFYKSGPKIYKTKSNVILRSWISKEIFNSFDYKDRNFGTLGETLRGKGNYVWYSPMFFNLDRSLISTLFFISDFRENFFFPERYVSWWTSVKVIKRFVKTLSFSFKNMTFRGFKVDKLLRDVHWKISFPANDLHTLTFGYALEKIASKYSEFELKNVFYTFENNVTEKILIISVKSRLPETKMVAFQHSVLYKENLATFLSLSEIGFHPLPDKLITNGKRYLDVICKELRFPSHLIVNGPSLRFNEILFTKIPFPDRSGLRKKVIILLNFDIHQNFELLEKIAKPLQEWDVDIFIKIHPVVKKKDIATFLHSISFPNFQFCEGVVVKLASLSDTVIMPACSVSNLEVMICGVPLLRVSLASNFDFDPLWDISPFPPFCYSQEDIRLFLKRSFNLDPKDKEELKDFGQMIRDNYFSPVNEESLRAFD